MEIIKKLENCFLSTTKCLADYYHKNNMLKNLQRENLLLKTGAPCII